MVLNQAMGGKNPLNTNDNAQIFFFTLKNKEIKKKQQRQKLNYQQQRKKKQQKNKEHIPLRGFCLHRYTVTQLHVTRCTNNQNGHRIAENDAQSLCKQSGCSVLCIQIC